MSKALQKAGFVLRFRYWQKSKSAVRKLWFSLWGMKIGTNTNLPDVFITWPHQVSIGNKCRLEQNIRFKFDGIWEKGPSICIDNDTFIGAGCEFNIRKFISIGKHGLIASGCKFIDHDHGMMTGQLMKEQHGTEQEITIGDDVWLGVNVVVLKGVTIGNGAVVAAGAIVTKSVPANEIWAGVPARKISQRNA